jgi:putative membrane protein
MGMKHLGFKAALLAAALTLPNAASAESGSAFLADAAKGDNAEIMIGTLAKTKSADKGVRQYAATLVTDHTKAKKEVAELAKSMSVAMPPDVKPDAQQAYDKLSGLSGSDFDREFVNHMVQDHQKDIADFTKEAEAKDGKVSDLASKQLPTLKKHLAMAQALQSGKQSSMQAPQRIP